MPKAKLKNQIYAPSKVYTNKPCICGKKLPYGFNQSQLCFTCIESGIKISGFVGSGKVTIKA